MKPFDLVVVGAGFAGLSAALAVRDARRRVLVLEAQEYPGGRVRTTTHDDGMAYDRGGQFYASSMTHVTALVESYGLTRRQIRKDEGVVAMLSGVRRTLEDEFLAHHFFDALLQAEPDLPGTLGDWVRTLGLDAEAVAMITSGCEELTGRSIDELSYRSVRDVFSRIPDLDNTMEHCCVEGLGTLAALMADDLGDGFRAGTPVVAVDRREGLFHLTTATSAQDITAKEVLYAASPVVLGRVDWRAPEDEWLNHHGEHFVAGKMRKITLRYPTAFWRGSDFGWQGQTDDPPGLTVMDCSDLTDSLCLLTVFCGGSADMSLDGLSDGAALNKVLDAVEPMVGSQVRHPVSVVQTRWTDHPWVGGGYLTWARPWLTEDPWAPLREEHDGLHFCGAELASTFPGFIEGAVRSGREVAARITPGDVATPSTSSSAP